MIFTNEQEDTERDLYPAGRDPLGMYGPLCPASDGPRTHYLGYRIPSGNRHCPDPGAVPADHEPQGISHQAEGPLVLSGHGASVHRIL